MGGGLVIPVTLVVLGGTNPNLTPMGHKTRTVVGVLPIKTNLTLDGGILKATGGNKIKDGVHRTMVGEIKEIRMTDGEIKVIKIMAGGIKMMDGEIKVLKIMVGETRGTKITDGGTKVIKITVGETKTHLIKVSKP